MPFCLYIFLPVRETSLRIWTLWVPARRLASCQVDAALQDVAADFVDAEDVVGQLDRAALAAVEGDDVEFHCASPLGFGVGFGRRFGLGRRVGGAAGPPWIAPGFGRSAGAARFTASRIFT